MRAPAAAINCCCLDLVGALMLTPTHTTQLIIQKHVMMWPLIGQVITIKASNWFKHQHHKPLLLLHSRIMPEALWTLAKLPQSPLSYL